MESYVLVTPVRDEVSTVGRTIESVTSQTALPREWVLVSDGSTDGTDEVISRAAGSHPWIRLIRLQPRPGRNFAAVVRNTELGVRSLVFQEYQFLGLLDADVAFQRDYFEQLLDRFRADPALGLAGGVVIDVGTSRQHVPRNRMDVPGAVQFFRRRCYESLGGLLAVPEGGWDALTCAMARMRGYRTCLFADLVVDHLKPRNLSQGNPIRRKWQLGVRDYALGYGLVFEGIKCLSRLGESPVLLASMAWWLGYCTAALRRHPRVIPDEVVQYVQQEQRARLRRMLGGGGAIVTPPSTA